MPQSTSQVTHLLQAWRRGDPSAAEKLMPLVYEELRRIAQGYMAREGPGHTLQTTALVNEAYLRVAQQDRTDWKDRLHFFAISAQMMRRLLVDRARRRHRSKRGGNWERVSFDRAEATTADDGIDVLALHEALGRLAVLDSRKSQMVELRYFGGLDNGEIAELLEIAPATVKREWSKAKAWLYNELRTERQK